MKERELREAEILTDQRTGTPFNVNEQVWVRLNDRGREIIRQRHEALRKDFPSIDRAPHLPKEDENGWSRWQLWDLMMTFGPSISIGLNPPFDTTIYFERKDNMAEYPTMESMAARVVEVCEKRGWSKHWTHRGAYLHLEASELIEAIRGKHGDPTDEAGDVLLVLMSITEYAGIPFSSVIRAAQRKLDHLGSAPPYPGEEREQVRGGGK